MIRTFDDAAVVMITMNEEESVRDVVRSLRRDVPGATVTIVDSSTDRTPEIADEEGVEIVRQFPPQGYGPAMLRALSHPDRDIIVTLDCDGTYPTDRIPELVKLVRDGCAVAGTTRLTGGRPAAMPWLNYLANLLFNVVASIFFVRRVRDVHSGMRAYSRETIHGFAWYAPAPALPVDLLLIPMRAGLKVREVSIPYGKRAGDSTLNRFSSTVWTFRRILRSRFTKIKRLRHGANSARAKADGD
jgi:glycosyltransferase involved in cell wall biosynthesis